MSSKKFVVVLFVVVASHYSYLYMMLTSFLLCDPSIFGSSHSEEVVGDMTYFESVLSTTYHTDGDFEY